MKLYVLLEKLLSSPGSSSAYMFCGENAVTVLVYDDMIGVVTVRKVFWLILL